VYHKNFWTVEKIGRRIQLLEESRVAYRRTVDLPAFRYLELPTEGFTPAPPQLGAGIDRTGWTVIAPDSYWGKRYTNFMLSTTFTVPADWPADGVIALYLPLGESGDFSHPETLAYIDGVALRRRRPPPPGDSPRPPSVVRRRRRMNSTCTAGPVSSATP
jgi:alpha-mannosidase